MVVMGTAPDHEALLTLARKVQAAATDADPDRMERATHDFTAALDRHLRSEIPRLGRMVAADARILERGQHRIHRLAGLLDGASGRHCRDRDARMLAGELVARLDLQSRRERLAWSGDRP